jgi:hypothetical protein
MVEIMVGRKKNNGCQQLNVRAVRSAKHERYVELNLRTRRRRSFLPIFLAYGFLVTLLLGFPLLF